ncbi:hypothetical protein CSKR_102550 [Clonorchis sinensis]|uniref:Uncharacterized protein n=1 Tax=Clonorchis sinensis TaxID=79923 RepID=A0A3R7DN34_CLOSI|nr:hypothetical protein CSKR_102550 [Clonorchis sinensis]
MTLLFGNDAPQLCLKKQILCNLPPYFSSVAFYSACLFLEIRAVTSKVNFHVRIVPENGSKVYLEGVFGENVCGSATITLNSATQDPMWQAKQETCSRSDTSTTITVYEHVTNPNSKNCGELFLGCCTWKDSCIRNITTPKLENEFPCTGEATDMWVAGIRTPAECQYQYTFKWVYGTYFGLIYHDQSRCRESLHFHLSRNIMQGALHCLLKPCHKSYTQLTVK